MKSYDIVGYTYDADMHCEACALARFPELAIGETATDSEENQTHPIFADSCGDDDACGDCFRNLLTGDLPDWVTDKTMNHYRALTGIR